MQDENYEESDDIVVRGQRVGDVETHPEEGEALPTQYQPETNNEPSKKDLEIQTKFHSLAADIRQSFSTVFSLFGKIEVVKRVEYIVLSSTQEEEFTLMLETVNENLGKAQTMLDAYIRLSGSTPKFERFLNKYFDFNTFLNEQRERPFYKIHVRDEGKYMYPHDKIIRELKELQLLFSRLSGTLIIAGDYYVDEPPSRGGGMGGGYADEGMGYPSGGYVPSYRPPVDYESGVAPMSRALPELRDIGDGKDERVRRR